MTDALVIAAIRSIVTYVAVALYVLVVGPPFCCWRSSEPGGLLYRVGLLGVRLGLF